jgi:hypothetical protein
MIVVLRASPTCGHALSPRDLAGGGLSWWVILPSFSIPRPPWIVNHVSLVSSFGPFDTGLGVILSRLMGTVAVVVSSSSSMPSRASGARRRWTGPDCGGCRSGSACPRPERRGVAGDHRAHRAWTVFPRPFRIATRREMTNIWVAIV